MKGCFSLFLGNWKMRYRKEREREREESFFYMWKVCFFSTLFFYCLGKHSKKCGGAVQRVQKRICGECVSPLLNFAKKNGRICGGGGGSATKLRKKQQQQQQQQRQQQQQQESQDCRRPSLGFKKKPSYFFFSTQKVPFMARRKKGRKKSKQIIRHPKQLETVLPTGTYVL